MIRVETEQETDGRWVAECGDLSGVLAYGSSKSEAVAKAQALALRVLSERLEHRERIPSPNSLLRVSRCN